MKTRVILGGLAASVIIASFTANIQAGRRMVPADGKAGLPHREVALPFFENTNGVIGSNYDFFHFWEMYPYIDSGGSKAALVRLRGNHNSGISCHALAHRHDGFVLTVGVSTFDTSDCGAPQSKTLPAVTVPSSPQIGMYTVKCQLPNRGTSCQAQITHVEL